MSEKKISLNSGTGSYVFDTSYYSLNNKDSSNLYGTPGSNLLRGGQWGHLPIIGVEENGSFKHAWMSDQAYIKRDIIPIVLQAPKGFELLPNGEYFKKAVIALFEKHARVIEGLDSSITVNVGEHELGLEGAKYQEPTNVTVAESNVSLTLSDKYGQAWTNFLDVWIRYLIMDPDTKSPLISQYLSSNTDDSLLINGFGINKNTWSTEYYTATVLFIEPDILNARVVNAWLVSNLFPHSVPNITGRKDKKADKEVNELTVEFGGFAIHSRNIHVRKLAQDILNKLKLYSLTNDNILPPASGIDPTLKTKDKDDQLYYDQTGNTESSAYDSSTES